MHEVSVCVCVCVQDQHGQHGQRRLLESSVLREGVDVDGLSSADASPPAAAPASAPAALRLALARAGVLRGHCGRAGARAGQSDNN